MHVCTNLPPMIKVGTVQTAGCWPSDGCLMRRRSRSWRMTTPQCGCLWSCLLSRHAVHLTAFQLLLKIHTLGIIF